MRLIGNILWFVFAGLWLWLGWTLAGLLWCVTIVGIPWGLQCFKSAKLMFAPFGKDVVYSGSVGSVLLNVLWILVSGVPLAIEAAVIGLVLCITIVGIPWGLQCFKYAQLAFMPFGARIVTKHVL